MSDRKSVEAKLTARARTDRAFRELLCRDPRAALEKELGVKLPDGISLHVHEEGPNVLHMVLPAVPGGELTDAELAAAAGGVTAAPKDGWGTD